MSVSYTHLKEHSRLVKVFQDLYDNLRNGADWSNEEAQYSLFLFVNKFCKRIDHRHFADRLINDVQNDGKDYDRANRHPTRAVSYTHLESHLPTALTLFSR